MTGEQLALLLAFTFSALLVGLISYGTGRRSGYHLGWYQGRTRVWNEWQESEKAWQLKCTMLSNQLEEALRGKE